MNDLLHQLGQGIQFHIFIDLLIQIYTVQYQNLQNVYFPLVNPIFFKNGSLKLKIYTLDTLYYLNTVKYSKHKIENLCSEM